MTLRKSDEAIASSASVVATAMIAIFDNESSIFMIRDYQFFLSYDQLNTSRSLSRHFVCI